MMVVIISSKYNFSVHSIHANTSCQLAYDMVVVSLYMIALKYSCKVIYKYKSLRV